MKTASAQHQHDRRHGLGHQNGPCVSLESAGLNLGSPASPSGFLGRLCELVAQLVEQRPFKAWVLGSIPSELTTQNK